MKKIVFVFFITLCSFGFAQKQTVNYINRTHYYYTVLNVEDEQLLQQVVEEITAYKGVIDCKYRMKPEKKMAEISFTFDEQPRKSEGDKSNSAPDAKKLNFR